MKPLHNSNPDSESFFSEPVDPKQEARAMALEVISRVLIWLADGETTDERGMRVAVALYCIRPDLIKGATLEEIGLASGRTKQAVHKLADLFRATTGLEP